MKSQKFPLCEDCEQPITNPSEGVVITGDVKAAKYGPSRKIAEAGMTSSAFCKSCFLVRLGWPGVTINPAPLVVRERVVDSPYPGWPSIQPIWVDHTTAPNTFYCTESSAGLGQNNHTLVVENMDDGSDWSYTNDLPLIETKVG